MDMIPQNRLVRTPALWTLYLLLGLFSYFLNAIGPAVPALQAEFHFDYTMSALHVSAFAVGMILAGLAGAAVIRRIGARWALWGGQIGLLLGLTALVLAPSPWVSLLAILFAGVTGTISMAAIQASVAQLGGVHRGKAIMESNIAASLMSAAAPFVLILGAAIGLGWRALWPAFALVFLATLWFGFRAIRTSIPDQTVGDDSATGKLPRGFLRYWLLTFFGVAVEWCLGFWAASYLKHVPGGTPELAVFGAGVFQLAAIGGRLLSSRLTGHFGEKHILLGAIAVTAVGFPLYWTLWTPVTALLGLMLCGAGVALFYPLALSLAIGIAGTQASKASSLSSVAAGTAVLAAPLSLGALADHWGLSTALLAAPMGLVVMLLLLTIGSNRKASAGTRSN